MREQSNTKVFLTPRWFELLRQKGFCKHHQPPNPSHVNFRWWSTTATYHLPRNIHWEAGEGKQGHTASIENFNLKLQLENIRQNFANQGVLAIEPLCRPYIFSRQSFQLWTRKILFPGQVKKWNWSNDFISDDIPYGQNWRQGKLSFFARSSFSKDKTSNLEPWTLSEV